MSTGGNKAVFLDRDGTINVEKHYLYKIEDFEYLDGVVEGLKALSDMGYLLVVVTNQSGIARGYYTEDDYRRLDEWMKADLLEKGVKIAASYYCPHLPDGVVPEYAIDCDCRKPKTKLFWQAADDLDIDMSKSYAIGDKARDLSICDESDVKGILLGEEKDPEGNYTICRNWTDIVEKIRISGSANVAIYGLGTETQRFLSDQGDELSVVGLLDGFRTDGEMYGYPIIPLKKTIEKGVKRIIVVARPGSCKAITKRIGDFCRENDIELYDVRGNDLLAPVNVAYDFSGVKGYSLAELRFKIAEADVVSFDLFDTLVTRKLYQYTDVFELVDIKLKEMGIDIPGFAGLRLSAEKHLSKERSPKLTEIYEEVLRVSGIDGISVGKLCEIEWETDLAAMTPRRKVCEIFREAVESGKDVVITSDCYNSKEQICCLLDKLGINGYRKVFVSSEYDTLKTQSLFDELIKEFPGRRLLHIGDDETADIDSASVRGIDTFRLYSGMQLYDALGGLGADAYLKTITDRVKLGLFISRIFNDPFVFGDSDQRLCVNDAGDIGYLFCAPMITDFVHWMKDRSIEEECRQLLFCARDGYLVKKLYEMIDPDAHSYYFLTSRTAAIRAGVEDENDIEYVDGMKYSGTVEEATMKRFGIDISHILGTRQEAILEKARKQRELYGKYIKALGINGADIAMFDFVAKGTTQMYLARLFEGHMKGYYFLQLEPEFMAEKGLDIEPFYSDKEKDTSQIFDNYYILETILTAPYPQMLEFDDECAPIYARETRSKQDLSCFERAQAGIIQFFEDYISIMPEEAREENKALDEALLALVNRVEILDDDFLSLKVEDLFFGRMTDIRDVLG